MIGSRRRRILTLAALMAAVVAAAVVAPLDVWGQALMEAQLWRSPTGVVVFVLLYVAWNFALPPAPLQLLAGLHYGIGGGLAAVVVGASLANAAGHGVGRLLGRGWVARQIEDSRRLAALEKAVDQMGWRAVALARLSNLIPSNLANLLMGATPLKLPTILWASVLGSLPGWALMLGLGQGGRVLLDTESDPVVAWTIYAVAGLASLALLVLVGRRTRRILENTVDAGESTN